MRNLITTIGAMTSLALMPASYGQDKKGDTVKDAKGKTLEEQMIGYWAPDPEAMMAQFMKEIGDDPSAALMIPMIKAMLENMAVEVTKDKVTIYAMGDAQTSTYTVTKTDPKTSTVTMTVKDDDGESEGTAVIKGKKLTLSKDEDDLALNSISKAEFEKRKAAAKQPPVIPGLE